MNKKNRCVLSLIVVGLICSQQANMVYSWGDREAVVPLENKGVLVNPEAFDNEETDNVVKTADSFNDEEIDKKIEDTAESSEFLNIEEKNEEVVEINEFFNVEGTDGIEEATETASVEEIEGRIDDTAETSETSSVGEFEEKTDEVAGASETSSIGEFEEKTDEVAEASEPSNVGEIEKKIDDGVKTTDASDVEKKDKKTEEVTETSETSSVGKFKERTDEVEETSETSNVGEIEKKIDDGIKTTDASGVEKKDKKTEEVTETSETSSFGKFKERTDEIEETSETSNVGEFEERTDEVEEASKPSNVGEIEKKTDDGVKTTDSSSVEKKCQKTEEITETSGTPSVEEFEEKTDDGAKTTDTSGVEKKDKKTGEITETASVEEFEKKTDDGVKITDAPDVEEKDKKTEENTREIDKSDGISCGKRARERMAELEDTVIVLEGLQYKFVNGQLVEVIPVPVVASNEAEKTDEEKLKDLYIKEIETMYKKIDNDFTREFGRSLWSLKMQYAYPYLSPYDRDLVKCELDGITKNTYRISYSMFKNKVLEFCEVVENKQIIELLEQVKQLKQIMNTIVSFDEKVLYHDVIDVILSSDMENRNVDDVRLKFREISDGIDKINGEHCKVLKEVFALLEENKDSLLKKSGKVYLGSNYMDFIREISEEYNARIDEEFKIDFLDFERRNSQILKVLHNHPDEDIVDLLCTYRGCFSGNLVLLLCLAFEYEYDSSRNFENLSKLDMDGLKVLLDRMKSLEMDLFLGVRNVFEDSKIRIFNSEDNDCGAILISSEEELRKFLSDNNCDIDVELENKAVEEEETLDEDLTKVATDLEVTHGLRRGGSRETFDKDPDKVVKPEEPYIFRHADELNEIRNSKRELQEKITAEKKQSSKVNDHNDASKEVQEGVSILSVNSKNVVVDVENTNDEKLIQKSVEFARSKNFEAKKNVASCNVKISEKPNTSGSVQDKNVKMTLKLDPRYNGVELAVVQKPADGNLEMTKCVVKDGKIDFDKKASQFVVLGGEDYKEQSSKESVNSFKPVLVSRIGFGSAGASGSPGGSGGSGSSGGGAGDSDQSDEQVSSYENEKIDASSNKNLESFSVPSASITADESFFSKLMSMCSSLFSKSGVTSIVSAVVFAFVMCLGFLGAKSFFSRKKDATLKKGFIKRHKN